MILHKKRFILLRYSGNNFRAERIFSMNTRAIVLAAGKGTRLMSETFNLPKVLREANGKPLIGHVLGNINFIAPKDTVVVVGYKGDMVKEYVGSEYNFALQAEQKGTGHAVMVTADQFEDFDGDVLILYGDMPLFKKQTYKDIIAKHKESGSDLTVLTSVCEEELAYGRIIRDENGKFVESIEQKDATPEQRLIREYNVGIYVAKSKVMFDALNKITNNNAQGEYYLTDLPKILLAEGKKVETHTIYNTTEIFGVNTVEDLEFCEKVLKENA